MAIKTVWRDGDYTIIEEHELDKYLADGFTLNGTDVSAQDAQDATENMEAAAPAKSKTRGRK